MKSGINMMTEAKGIEGMLDLSSLVIPWYAWSKPGFNVPTTLSWSDVSAIPEENRVKDLLGTDRIGKRPG
ncbi:unnamed protein product [Clonostachys solani]|uniref:Uncharacterized protein n=1 Tax=Clonostachys solani TaxID=160281 RepID=A0A9N9ZN28_9HYPO|nr:unnamed protein product [Clonostachys solani]